MINIKKINNCFELLKYRMKIIKLKNSKKNKKKLQNEIKKLTYKIENYKQSFNKQEYEHYVDLYYVELCKRNIEVEKPEHTRFATIN
jgi:hypothetical protein